MTHIYNPTKNTIEVKIFGVTYVINPESTLQLPEEAAKYWVKNLHTFITIVKDTVESNVTESTETTETVDEVEVTEVKKVSKKGK